ncbi:MAG: S8 family serine peptidase, partial [Gemmatimonadota bacterium]
VTPSGRRAAGPSGLERNVRYDGWLGTSMACPQVTAAVAMLVGMHGPMAPDDVRLHLMRTATPLPAMRGRSFTMSCGAGRLDVARLLADAARGPRARTRRTGR